MASAPRMPAVRSSEAKSAAEEADEERPTLRTLDPASYAQKLSRTRSEYPTFTDPVELEAARVRSVFTIPPPADHPTAAAEVRVQEEDVFLDVAESARGSLDRVPFVKLGGDAIAALPLDHRAGFILALIDGTLSVGTLLDVSGMTAQDALTILDDLEKHGVIGHRA